MSMYFNGKVFDSEIFGKYIDRVPNVKRSQLIKSGAIGTNDNAKSALSNGTGSFFARIPYYGRISSTTSQNNNGATDIVSNNTSTMSQGFITASRMDSWTEKSFSKNITGGVDFMDNVAQQISEYKQEVKQDIILAMLKGIYSMDTTGSDIKAAAAKEFIENHTLDTSNVEGVAPESLNKAIQKACGDNKSIIKLAIMDSTVATDLENQKLLSFMKYTDADGITRDLSIATWNGRTVLIDDDMPTEEKDGNTLHTTYLLGEGSIVLDEIPDSNPYEIWRDPKANGGEDYLFVRDRFMCGFESFSFEGASTVDKSATNADLANGANWAVINNGDIAIPTKSIAIARLITRG